MQNFVIRPANYACYLIDVRNDGVVQPEELTYHRQVIKEHKSLQELKDLGSQLLTKHPECDRMTIVGSGRRLNTQWLYDSANKVKVTQAERFIPR